jgi:Ca2+-binding EF-hand superfamily protein
LNPADIRTAVRSKLTDGALPRQEVRNYVQSLDQRLGDATLNKMLNAREIIGVVSVAQDGAVTMTYKLGGD